ncbi:MAG: MFS transporter, partial [Clostridiales bacterium]
MSSETKKEVSKPTKMLYRNKLNGKQMAVFLCAITMYLFYYFSKSNLSVATSPMQEAFGFSSAEFGIILTTASIVYALGQFINGFLSDRLGAKIIFFIGAIGAVVGNFLFGFSSSLVMFTITWAFTIYFLSMGWAPSMKLIFDWFPQKRWGLFGGLNNAFCYLGSALVTPLAGLCIAQFGWQGAFFIPPLFTLGFAVVFFIVVKNTPKDAGFDVEWSNDDSLKSNDKGKVDKKDYLQALLNGKMQIGYFCDFFANMVRWVMVSWIIKILMDAPEIGGFGMAIVTASLVGS